MFRSKLRHAHSTCLPNHYHTTSSLITCTNHASTMSLIVYKPDLYRIYSVASLYWNTVYLLKHSNSLRQYQPSWHSSRAHQTQKLSNALTKTVGIQYEYSKS